MSTPGAEAKVMAVADTYCAFRLLDLSFNLLKAVPDCLEYLPALDTIYFVQNRISKISGLQASTSLRSLELGGNKIRVCFTSSALCSHLIPCLEN